MNRAKNKAVNYAAAIRKSGLTLYDAIEVGSPLWIPSRELERLLDKGLRGIPTSGIPNRTRSKMVKSRICENLGYPIPKSFKRCRPRFFGQDFDAYVQAADNLQVWNDQLSPTRRYVLIRPRRDGRIAHVKVVAGTDLAALDRTGTFIQKYQARLILGQAAIELISPFDTERLRSCLSQNHPREFGVSPIAYPTSDSLLPIAELYSRLKGLVGMSFADLGSHQERNRGAGLHRLICEALHYPNYRDDGRFPDVKHQLLEIKLQTAATIDLGLVTPASEAPLDVPKINDAQVRHCDVRYALFCGETDGQVVTLTRFYLTTGRDFLGRFPQCQGRILNKKLQIRLPRDFFTRQTESLAD
ncbi:MAG TPA: hypothetical protein VFC44_05930 [Candidatus Saccharimonadales bacterium]|nr:hypothetical protein [Candidatus Saccharimonadales bacterium]